MTTVTVDWLNRQANDLLAKAEAMYLTRDRAFRFDGVKLADCGPHVRFHLDGIGVGFELDRAVVGQPLLAHYQVAHEVIHMLAPDRCETGAKMLEEGLATYFSIYGPDFFDMSYRQTLLDWYQSSEVLPNYRDALTAYQQLIALEPNAIVLLREIEPNFYAMTYAQINSVVPQADDELIQLLLSRRKMR